MYFSFNDLLELKFIQSLRDKGAPTKKIRKALAYLRKNMKKDFAELYVDASSDDIRVYNEPEALISAARDQEELLIINIGKMKREIHEKAEMQSA